MRYCIVGEAWGFRGIYMYSGGGADPYHCPRCIDLSGKISDAYYLSLEKSKDLGDAKSAFVDHWNDGPERYRRLSTSRGSRRRKNRNQFYVTDDTYILGDPNYMHCEIIPDSGILVEMPRL